MTYITWWYKYLYQVRVLSYGACIDKLQVLAYYDMVRVYEYLYQGTRSLRTDSTDRPPVQLLYVPVRRLNIWHQSHSKSQAGLFNFGSTRL